MYGQGTTVYHWSPFTIILLLTTLPLGTLSQSSTTGATTGSTTTDLTTTDLPTTTDPLTTSDLPTTTAADVFEEENTNNVTWLIIGVVVAIVVVLIIVIGVAIAYGVYRSKRVHPHSDTESIYSEDEISRTRPTTASHIHFDPEDDEAMSKPVAMTPFELRKLYIETFPYSNWKKGFDGSLRPHMSLRFVPPNMYKQTKGDERSFREKIYNYENSDTLTLRSSALSRMMRHNRMATTHEAMETLSEDQHSHRGNGVPPAAHQHVNFEEENDGNMRRDDVDLF